MYRRRAFTEKQEVTNSTITSAKLGKLWDNLFYQVVSQQSFYSKELIMQLLLADHVLNNQYLTNIDNISYLELAHARIVLPEEMFLNESISANNSIDKSKAKSSNISYPTSEMKKVQEIAISNIILQKSDLLKSELSVLDKKHQKNYEKAHNQAYNDHQILIKPLLDKYNEDVEKERQRWCATRDGNVAYDPNDICRQPNQIPFPTIPEFSFKFTPEIDHKVLKTELSTESFNALVEFLGLTKERPTATDYDKLFELYDTYDSLYQIIDNVQSQSQKIIVDNTEYNPIRYKNIGGILIPVSRQAPLSPFSYQLCVKNIGKTTSNLDLTIVLPDSSWTVSNISYKLNSGGIDYPQTVYQSHSQTGDNYNTIYLTNLFGFGIADNLIADSEYFDATIWLSTGKKIELHITGLALRSCVKDKFTIFDEPKDNDFTPNKFGYRKLGIADYKKVEQSVQCYVAGEISHIENVMASEYREKSTRRLRRSEDTLTTSSEMEREQLTDTTSISRFEMQSEVAKLLSESKDFYGNASFSASYGMGDNNIQIGANAGFASHTTKEESTRQAMTMSQEITERALDRIVTKVKEERVIKIIEEFEENNHHGYDNRGNDQHVSGVYRWVDKLYKNQIINYGKRLMFEFMIPQPAKLHLLGLNELQQEEFDLIAPPDPRKVSQEFFPLKKPSDLTEANANFWAAWYNVEIEAKPEIEIYISKSFSKENTDYWGQSGDFNIDIPENYHVISCLGYLNTSKTGQHSDGNGHNKTKISIAGKTFPMIGYPEGDNGAPFRQYKIEATGLKVRNNLGIALASWRTKVYGLELTLKCSLNTEVHNQWKQDTFNAIISAYEDKLNEFNDKKAEFEDAAKNVEETNTNPGFYRKIENMVLRKNCISYMMDRSEGAIYKYGREGMYLYDDFMNLEVNTDAALDAYTSFVKFMEQAFEWENISYNFYPYYWGNKYNWKNMYNTTEGDALFNSFLQSGMARVIAPVRPGFEDAVQFYLATGQIWNGGQIPVIGDPLYMSIVDELKDIKGTPEGKAWITRVPTALTIIQAGSIGLEVENALPCKCDDKDEFEDPSQIPCDNGFKPTDSVLDGGINDHLS